MATNEEQTAVDPVSESLAKTSARDSAPVIARTEASLRPALPRRTPTGTPSIPVSGAPLADPRWPDDTLLVFEYMDDESRGAPR